LKSEENKAFAIFNEALCNTLIFKTLHVSNRAQYIVLGDDPCRHGWGAILQQEDENKDWDSCHCDSRLWNTTEKRYDVGEHECCEPMEVLKMFCNCLYEVRFLMETEADNFMHQLS